MRAVISLGPMILAAVIALITVLISAWIPSKKGYAGFCSGSNTSKS